MLTMANSAINEHIWVQRSKEDVAHATRPELVVAIFVCLRTMRDAISRTLYRMSNEDARMRSCWKLQADYDLYPNTLQGLAEYLDIVAYGGAEYFLLALLEHIRDHLQEQHSSGIWYVSSRPDLVDTLPRPEWWQHLNAVMDSPPGEAASRMLDLVTEGNSEVECRPWMLSGDNVEQTTSALRRALATLDAAATRTFEKHKQLHADEPLAVKHVDCLEYLAAQEVRVQFGGYPFRSLEALRSHLKPFAWSTLCNVYCRVLECIIHATSIHEGLRVVSRRPLEPFPFATVQ